MLYESRDFKMVSQDMPFGTWVSYRRKQLGLTQADIASALKIKQPIVSKLENGTYSSLSEAQVDVLAKMLEVPLEDILQRMIPPDPPVTVTDSIGRRWRVLSKDGGLAKEMAEALSVLGFLEVISDKA